VRPPGACASIRKASDMGAEQNHLCPVMRYSFALTGSARVELARTSDPPCFSVMAMPINAPLFSPRGRRRGSYRVETMVGSHSRASSGSRRITGMDEYVIDT